MRAYAEYAQAVKKVFYLALRIGVARGLPHPTEPLEPDPQAMELLSKAEAERASAWESVLLMGDPQTVAAARAWHQTIWHLVGFAQGRVEGANQWQAAKDASAQARDKFYESARRDLGVQGEAVTTPPWTPEWMQDPAASRDLTEG
jgi:hypothetical protein